MMMMMMMFRGIIVSLSLIKCCPVDVLKSRQALSASALPR